MIEVFRYPTASGQKPVTERLQSQRDKQAQAKTQAADIKTAKDYWADWKRRQT